MAKKNGSEVKQVVDEPKKAAPAPASAELDDDEADGDFEEIRLDDKVANEGLKQVAVRRRLEDYLEEKRLKEQLQDDFYL